MDIEQDERKEGIYRTSLTLVFIPIYCTSLFRVRIHIPRDRRSSGICILAQNKRVQ